MYELICTFRAAQLYLHQAHLLAKGSLFLQDHEFLGELYAAMESDFDAVSERLIGMGGESQFNLQEMMKKVVEKLASYPSTNVKENKEYFIKQLEIEKSICDQVNALCKQHAENQGLVQLLGDCANRSQIRVYKISRRIK